MADNSMSPNHEMLSDYKKVKTESLRFMLENTTFLRDKKDAFLALYEEYKKEKSHERHKELNAMLREYRYDERWLFLGDGELDQIAEIVQKWKTDTDAARESTAAQTQNLSATVTAPAPTNEAPKSSSETGVKYSLEVSRGYALEKLGKYNLSISDLQKALTDAKAYSGPVNGQFDQATLDSVVAFQKAKNLGVDGLVGIGQTIPALFPALVISPANTPSGTPTGAPADAPKGQVGAGLSPVPQGNGVNTRASSAPKKNQEQQLDFIRKVTYMKDGRVYLMGENGKQQVVSYDMIATQMKLPKNAPENLQKSIALVDDFSIFLETLMAHDPTYKSKVTTAVRTIELALQNPNISYGKVVINLKPILERVYPANADNVNGGIHAYLISIFKNPNQSERRSKLYEYMRDEFGQSDFVAMKIIDANAGYFKFPKDEDILKNNIKVPGLKQEAISEIQESIRKARETAASDWKENYATYLAQFKKQNPGVSVDEEKARQLQERGIVLATARKEIVYQTLYNKKGLNSDLALLQDILGAGTWDMSDKSWDLSKEVLGMIAIEAIAIAAGTLTVGLGTYAINAAMFARNAYKGARIVEGVNTVSSLRRFATSSLRVVGQGGGFELGAATARSFIENGDFTSMHSREAYMQSILMMGALHGLGKFFSSAKSPEWLKFREGKTNIVPFVGQVTIEGGAIFGISGITSSIVFDHKDNWTLEQMAQAFMMATILKGFARCVARKDAQGNIEVVPLESQSTRLNVQGFRDMHIHGDALYDQAVKAGRNHVQIKGLPDGYRIGLTEDTARIEIMYPNGSFMRFDKSELEQKITNIFQRIQREAPDAVPTSPKPDSPEIPSSGAQAHVTDSVAGVTLSVNQIKNIDTILGQYKKALGKKPGSEVDVAGFILTRQDDGLVHIKGEGMGKGMVFKQDEAFKYVRSAILNSQEQGASLIQKALREGVSKWHGKPQPLGPNHELRRINGEAVVYEKSTKRILEGEAEKAVLMEHAHKILKGKTEKFLEVHGDKKAFFQVGKDSFAFNSWYEWSGNRAWYNPIKVPSHVARWLSTLTLRELIQPVLTLKAFKDVFTTQSSMLGYGNNFLKAVILRDINPNWISGEAFKTVFGRGLLFSATLPAAYSVMHSDSEGAQRDHINWGDALITGGELYYGGLIWGTLLQHFTTDSQPLTWEYGNTTPRVEVPPSPDKPNSHVDIPSTVGKINPNTSPTI